MAGYEAEPARQEVRAASVIRGYADKLGRAELRFVRNIEGWSASFEYTMITRYRKPASFSFHF